MYVCVCVCLFALFSTPPVAQNTGNTTVAAKI